MSEERTRIQNQYDKDYYVDYMNRSDIQSLVKKLQEQSKKRLDNAEATAVVTGTTPEAIVAQKQAESEVLGQSMSQIAGYSDQWKQQVADRYNQQMSNLMGMQLQENSQKSASYANMVSNFDNKLMNYRRYLDDQNRHYDMLAYQGKIRRYSPPEQ